MPDTCQIYQIQSGDTCGAITDSADITFTQLRAWNPFVNPTCSNLIAGDSVCVSQPGPVWTGTPVLGATATKTGVYATSTATPAGALAHGMHDPNLFTSCEFELIMTS
jgi:LysM repeat protein